MSFKLGDRVVIVATRPGFERLRGCRAKVVDADWFHATDGSTAQSLKLWVKEAPPLTSRDVPYLRAHDIERLNRGCIYSPARPDEELRLMNVIEAIGDLDDDPESVG